MERLISKFFSAVIFVSFLFNQEMIINNIDIRGLITASEKQIFRNSGLRPSEPFMDNNNNNNFDEGEQFTDINNNGLYDFGSKIFRGDEFNNAINNLWRLNVFSDIQISVIDSYDDYINILIEVEELPILNNLNIKGNNKIKDNKIIEVSNLKKTQRVSLNDIYNAKNSIKEAYAEQNYHSAIVDIQLKDNQTDYSKDVSIEIIENNKLKIKSIDFIGNKNISKKNLLKNCQYLSEKKWYKFWKGDFNQDELNLDVINFEMLYKNHGYRDVQIEEPIIAYNEDGISIKIEIDEGEVNYYGTFNFEGNIKFTDSELLKSIGLKTDQMYSENEFNMALYNLNSTYMDEGFYFINISNSVIPVGTNKLNVSFKINESEKTKIRKIIISGNDKTHDNVIRRELEIIPGDVFSMKKIEDSYRRIFMLDYFENVDPRIINIGEATNIVDLEFDVLEKETGRANFSMGYNEIHGLTGGGGFDFSNFRGKGQMLSVSYNRGLQNQNQFGTQNTSYSNNNNSDFESFSFSFREPRIFDSGNSIGFSYSHSEQGRGSSNLLQYDTESDRISVLFGRRFNWPDRYFKGSWSFTMRNTKYIGELSSLQDDFDESIIIEENSEEGHASRTGVSLTQTISRDSRNHPQFPTSGSKFIWQSTFSGDILGGNENYHKHTFDFNWFNEMYDNIALYQNYTFGTLVELGNNQFLPYSARFLLGGSGLPYGEMLRGYPDNGIGPKVNTGYYYNYSGGKVMMKYSAELRYKLSDEPIMFLHFFAEAGNIWSDFNTVDIFKLKRSIGMGFRINMPMLGTLGYDVGYGFDSIYDDPEHPRHNEPYGWEQHIIFGMPMN